jgi:HAD superfamily hydrolase (TIGR01509 family)
MTYKALIFDFDGTIQDTENAEYQAWQETVHMRGHEITHEIYSSVVGNMATTADAFDWISSHYGLGLIRDVDLPAIIQRSLEIRMQQSPRPGVVEYLKSARESEMTLAIASSSNRTWIDTHLDIIKLVGKFDVISTADDVTNIKPDPELFLLTLDRLAITPDQAIVFEDSPNGVKAAKAAGITTVAVPNDVTRYYCFDEADLIIPSMAEVPLQSLLAKLNHNHSN